MGAAEQQRAGCAIDGDPCHSGPQLCRQLPAELLETGAPTAGIGEGSGIGGGELSAHLPLVVDQGQADPAGTQINPEAKGLRRQREPR